MKKSTQIKSIDPYDWTEILRANQSEKYDMVNRLLTDFHTGSNRFDAPGEILLAHFAGNSVIAVAGLNCEQENCFGNAGRLRRLYVVPKYRGNGLARSLVKAIANAASSEVVALTVNVGDLEVRGFYEYFGFNPVEHPCITHVKRLARHISMK